jgi:hypothetical protein
LYPGASTDIFNSYRFEEVEENLYLAHVSYGYSDGFSIHLEMHDSFILADERLSVGEAGGGLSYIIVPDDAPDPRLAIRGRYCEGGVISRLRPGMYATEAGFSQTARVSAVPGGETSQELENFFSVKENPVCVGDVLWWQIEDTNGNTAWHPENEGNQYLLDPQGRYSRNLVYCPVALAPRLLLGRDARVLAGFGANNLRAEANSNSELIIQIPEVNVFHVIDGPVCNEGMLWWYVGYNEIYGWTAEGDEESYWLEPLVSFGN